MGKSKKFWVRDSGGGPLVYQRKKDVDRYDAIIGLEATDMKRLFGREFPIGKTLAVRLVPWVKGDKVKGVYLRRRPFDYFSYKLKRQAKRTSHGPWQEIFCHAEFERITGLKLLKHNEVMRVKLVEV